MWNVKAELGEQVHESHVALLAFLEDIFRKGIRSGDFRSTLEPRVAAVSLIGVLTASVTDWITRSPEKPFAVLRPGAEEILAALYLPRPGRTTLSPRSRR